MNATHISTSHHVITTDCQKDQGTKQHIFPVGSTGSRGPLFELTSGRMADSELVDMSTINQSVAAQAPGNYWTGNSMYYTSCYLCLLYGLCESWFIMTLPYSSSVMNYVIMVLGKLYCKLCILFILIIFQLLSLEIIILRG